jgi:TPR repeat protein
MHYSIRSALAALLLPSFLLAQNTPPKDLMDQAVAHAAGIELATTMLWLYRSEAQGEVHAAEARKLLEEQLSPKAKLRVGLALSEGSKDVAANPEESIRWLRLAYQEKEEAADFLLALMLLNAYPEEHAEEAFQLLQGAVERGLDTALSPLARCHREGLGTAKNLERANFYSELAAQANDPEGQFWYAKALMASNKTKEALTWMQKAAFQGHRQARTHLVSFLRTNRERHLEKLSSSPMKQLASLVLYWRPGCPYCTRFDPIIKAVTKERNLPLRAVNIRDPAGTIEADVMEVSSVPRTLLLDEDGRILKDIKGAVSREELEKALDNASASGVPGEALEQPTLPKN